MEGFEVITSEDDRLGTVVGIVGENLVVEHGALFKSRHALPRTFVEVDESTRTVRTTLSKELIHNSPKLGDGDPDEGAVASYYGLAGDTGAPGADGYGALNADDPAVGASQEGVSAGMEPAEAQRVRIREGLSEGGTYGGVGRPIIPPDSSGTGGPS